MASIKNFLIKHRFLALYLFIATAAYLLIFTGIFKSKNFFWSSDAEIMSYPSRVFLYNSITKDHIYPFWTEKIFFGYAPYTDMQVAYLNPINVLAIIAFGPVLSYKLIHFISFILGALSFYYFAKKLITKDILPISLQILQVLGGISACVIYYSSFFNINHLIHLNLVAVTMLMPMHLYLADKMLTSSAKKYLILQSLLLAYGILWGHPQSTILCMILISIYLLSSCEKLLKIALRILLCNGLAIGLAFYQILPSALTFINGTRAESSLDYAKYSLMLPTSLSVIYPFMYGRWTAYQGLEVSGAFSIVEFYTYAGIASLIILTITLLLRKRDHFYRFIYFSLFAVLILAFWNNLPILNKLNFPLMTYFRYWARALSVLPLLTSLSVLTLYNLPQTTAQTIKKGIVLVSILIFIIALSGFGNLSSDISKQVYENFSHFNFSVLLKRDLLIWACLAFLSVVFVTVYYRQSKYKDLLYIFILLIASADIYYFSRDFIPVRIMKYTQTFKNPLPENLNNKRVLVESFPLVGYQPLLTNVRTPYGYSLFVDSAYSKYFFENKLGPKLRISYASGTTRSDLDIDALKRADVHAITLKDSIFYLTEPINYKVLEDTDANKVFAISEVKDNTLVLPVKYSANWQVRVSELRAKISRDSIDNIFTSIELPNNLTYPINVTFTYIPIDIFYGLLIGSISSTVCLIILCKTRSLQ